MNGIDVGLVGAHRPLGHRGRRGPLPRRPALRPEAEDRRVRDDRRAADPRLTYIDLEPFEYDADGRPIHPELPLAAGKGEVMIYRKPSSFMTTVQESLKRVESIMKKTDEALEKANNTLASVSTITASIADGDGFAARLIKDQQLANDLKTTIAKVALMADDLTSVTVSLRNREGAIGHLLASDDLIVQSEKLLAKARESLGSLDEVTKRLTGSVELVANRLDQAGASVEGVKQVLDNTKEITRSSRRSPRT